MGDILAQRYLAVREKLIAGDLWFAFVHFLEVFEFGMFSLIEAIYKADWFGTHWLPANYPS